MLKQRSLDELALAGGERILDLGSGLGQLTRTMARAAGPGSRVLGIERSEQQLEEAIRQAREAGEESLAEFRRGDVLAQSLAPAEWGSFDIAHARFVLEHVSDPLAVVRAMVGAVRPGGRIVLVDDDHDVLRLWPEPVRAVTGGAGHAGPARSAGAQGKITSGTLRELVPPLAERAERRIQ